METTTTTEVATISPDKCIAKVEVLDVEFLKYLSTHPDVEKDERVKLKRMAKSLSKGNQLNTQYKLGKHIKHHDIGRWIAVNSLSLQSLQRDLRNAIASANYIDVDMVNAQPSLLLDYCVKRGWACDTLKKYITDREALLEGVMEFCSIPRWEAKQRVVSVLFGGSASMLPEFFKNDFYNEIRKIQELLWNENKKDLKWLERQPNHFGKGLAYVLQTEERKCLEAMDVALAKRGRSLDTYIHDGGLVRRKEGEVTLTQTFLEEIEADVKKTTGYGIKLAVKPMETSWELEEEVDTNADYTKLKMEFEKEYFKLMSPACYVRLFEGKVYIVTPKEIVHQRQNYLLPDKSPFLSEWMKDTAIRTYERLVFKPKLEVLPHEFNLFTQFRVPPQENGIDISAVFEVLRLMCNSDEKLMEYVLKYVAHIFQRPYKKTQVAIVVQGDEGIGKDTFWNFIGSILGANEYFYNTKSPENDVFAHFNHGTEKCVLVKFEEADFKTNMTNKSKLKSIITNDTETYNQKNKDAVVLDDYRNFVMTTNEEIPVVVSDSDRRFVLIHASSEMKDKTDFWMDIHSKLDDMRVKAAFHQYLLTKDISGFVPYSPKDRVITAYYHEVRQSLAPYHAKWFYDYIESAKITRASLSIPEPTTSPTWAMYDLYKAMKDTYKWDYTVAKFTRDLKGYITAGAIIKKRSASCVMYQLEVDKCMEFLKSKDWVANDA